MVSVRYWEKREKDMRPHNRKLTSIIILATCNALSCTGGFSTVDLITAIQSSDRETRNQAVSQFSRSATQSQIDALVRLLGETSDPDVRIDVARALSMGRPSPQTVPALLKLIDIDQPYVRKTVVEALGRTGEHRTVEPLVAAFCDEDTEVRQAAAKDFQVFRHPKAFEPLLGMFSFDIPELKKGAWTHDSVREAVRALGHQGDIRAVPALKWIMATEVESLSRPAAKAIGEIVGQDFTEMVYVSMGHQMRLGSPSKAQAWLQEHPEVRTHQEGAKLLSMLERARSITKNLSAKVNLPGGGKDPIYLQLVPMGKLAVAALMDAGPSSCEEAMYALGHMHDPDLAGFFRRQAQRGNLVAMWALVYLGRRDMDDYFLDKLPKGGRPAGYAALALGRTGDRKFVRPLAKALYVSDSPRREIILALQELGDRAAVGDIREIFAHYPSADWAPLAVVAVEKLDATGNVEFFTVAVQSANAAAVARALEAIERVGNSSCIWYVEQTLKRTDLPESVMSQAKHTLAALRTGS